MASRDATAEKMTGRREALVRGKELRFCFLPESVLCIEDSIIALSADIASSFSL